MAKYKFLSDEWVEAARQAPVTVEGSRQAVGLVDLDAPR